jgi:hypothetical protein
MERVEGLGFMSKPSPVAQDAPKVHSAKWAHERLLNYVAEFEAKLDDTQEIGARLVALGSDITFHLEALAYENPDIIAFTGVTSEGKRVQLVQHHSQLSVLFVALPKQNLTPRRIGVSMPSAA